MAWKHARENDIVLHVRLKYNTPWAVLKVATDLLHAIRDKSNPIS